MSVGAVTQSLTVTGAAEVTDTQTSSVGAVIDNRKVVQLPLANRQFFSLALLSPAAAPSGQNSTLGCGGGFNISGTTEISNNFTADGIYNNDFGMGAPSADAGTSSFGQLTTTGTNNNRELQAAIRFTF